MTEHIQYRTVEHRDGHLASGMENGMQQTLTRLESVLASMASSGAMAQP